jgi:hypothetical protein
MIKITVNLAVYHALKQAFPKPANSADRALRKYVKVLEDMLFASLQHQATPQQRKLELFSISLQKLANQGGQIGPSKLRLHAWLRQNNFSLVEPVVKGSNISGTLSECRLTQWVTLVDTLAIEVDILIHSPSNRQIDQHLDGDHDSNIALMHLLYREFKRHQQNPAALNDFDSVEVDVESLKSCIVWLATEAKPLTATDQMTFTQAIQTLPFWLICIGLFACGFSMNLLGTHGMPMLMDHGFDPVASSMGIGLIGVVVILSTLVLGRLSDILPRRSMLSVIYLVRGLGFFALLVVGTQWELFLTSSIGGAVWAGSIALSSAILADVYGVRLVGSLYGWAYLSHQIGATVSSWLGGWGYDTFGTHWVAFGASGALLVAATVVPYRVPIKGQGLGTTLRAS